MPLAFRLPAAAAALLLLAPACSYDLSERPNAGSTANSADRPVPTSAPLRNVRWELRELDGQPAPATEQRPFLVLRDGRARAEGRAACNRFSGPYTLAAEGRLRLGPLVTTRSACPDLATEGAFMRALNQAQRYRIQGNTLSLYAADTREVPLATLQATAGE
ncbi:META domain-containing protein [Hymenobacter persicinus]|uniref:META domain-containing protein n=1 Tax=Hymenobacter persicinus TaxID=2025506 RepID=A0A4Q5LDS4_9BACT|nr:META domain-containing protein [Hymenobacter persicinus]RYU81890.1 META domain-containing protein [Hymenobacter persicinus]